MRISIITLSMAVILWEAGGAVASPHFKSVNNSGVTTAVQKSLQAAEQDGFTIDCNDNGLPDTYDIANGISEDCDQNGVPDECAEFGMSIENVEPISEGGEEGYAVTTTGAVFKVLPSHIDLLRRINPATNTVVSSPPVTATITFYNVTIDNLTVTCQSKQSCTITSSNGVSIDIRDDSLAFLSSAQEDIHYIYESQLEDPSWIGQKEFSDPSDPGQNGNRMWMRYGEGNLHLTTPNSNVMVLTGPDPNMPIHMIVPPGERTAFAVFPARQRDLDFLYGADARPHVAMEFEFPPTAETDTDFDHIAGLGFGTIVLFNGLYVDRSHNGNYAPDLIDHVWQYSFDDPNDPQHDQVIRNYIDNAHQHGFKVLAYIYPQGFYSIPTNTPQQGDSLVPMRGGESLPTGTIKTVYYQSLKTTLNWMYSFQQEYNLDGWYMDGAQPFGREEWVKNYDFIRAVRKVVGDDGIIFHHSSVDPWGEQGGDVVFAPEEAWENYTTRGETEVRAKVSGPNDPFIANIGTSHGGTLSAQTYRSHGSDITASELARLFQQNLWGFYRDSMKLLLNHVYWEDHGLPYWEARQDLYNNSPWDFSMAYDWPPSWYHELPLENINVTGTLDSVTVEFTTPVPTFGDIRVVYDAERYNFNHKDNNDQIIRRRYTCGDVPTISHSFTISGLLSEPHPTTAYRILIRGYEGSIRSCDPYNPDVPFVPDETMLHDVWGAVVITPGDCNGNGIDDATDIRNGTSQDVDGDGIPDECQSP